MTYSLSITGAGAGYLFGNKNLTISDSVAERVGTRRGAMMTNTPFLAQGPDGSQQWYTFDAERSTTANPVLKPVGP